ncbi:hypothetical protein [Actinoallomurus sp. CA-150999]|uniref:hypothetical protein n=1 Tax=Actinoallomurus sp. CA-150999 TaxID=3239887 RepID=UPI003D89E693
MYTNDWRIPADTKGSPHWAADLTAAEFAARGVNVLDGDLPLPLCVLREAALAKNSDAMARFVREAGHDVLLAPHGKTTMIPQLFHRQLETGSWGLSLANHHQVRVARSAGVSRIVLANQLVEPAEIDYVLDELARDPDFDFYCFADSVDGVAMLTERATRHSTTRPIQVFVEAGIDRGRCGVRTIDAAVTVGRAVVDAAPHLRLVGVAGYEGILQTSERREQLINDYLSFLGDVAIGCDGAGLFADAERVLLSAGGSAFYDRVIAMLADLPLSRPSRIVLRSGCYLAHDDGFYSRFATDLLRRDQLARRTDLSFEPALEIWSSVLSTPEPDRVVVSAGRRDFGEDAVRPAVIKHARRATSVPDRLDTAHHTIVAVYDQHAVIDVPDGHNLRVGDRIALSPGHPCTTFDKWRAIHLVDDAYIVRDVLATYF